MAIPDYEAVMLPLLRLTRDGNEWARRELIDAISREFGLTEDEKNQLLPSGLMTTINSRVGWAATYLRKAGLLESTRRGFNRITPRGLEVLQRPITELDSGYLEEFPEFREFRTRSRGSQEPAEESADRPERTPEELVEAEFQTMRAELAADIIERVKECSPGFFERLVIDVLVKMGYGGTRADAGRAVGRSGDGGIDGTINEDRLGLDVIYVQAKKWENVVGRPEIQKFVGALQGQRARKGVFITTSSFSKDAREYVRNIDSRIILIDGSDLAEFMITYDVGVTTHTTYQVKRMDLDYFNNE